MNVTFDVNDFKVTSHASGKYAWIDFNDHKKGVYMSMYVENVAEVDMLINQLEALKVKMEAISTVEGLAQ